MANFLAASVVALSNKKACSTVARAARSNEPFYHYTTTTTTDTIEIPGTSSPRRGCAKNPAKKFLVVGSGGIKEPGFA
jgi:hypothetical protein